MHPRSREVLLQPWGCGGAGRPSRGHERWPRQFSHRPPSCLGLFRGAGASPGLVVCGGEPLQRGLTVGSVPALPRYKRNQALNTGCLGLPAQIPDRSQNLPQPARRTEVGKAGWAGEGSWAFLASRLLFLPGVGSSGEPFPEAGGWGGAVSPPVPTHPLGQPSLPATPLTVPAAAGARSRGERRRLLCPPPR